MSAFILVVDDDPLVRSSLQDFLSDAGYSVATASDGVEAAQRFKEAKPDLVVTDIIMPEKDGIETILDLRRRSPALRIIAISGGGRSRSTDFLTMAEKLGADATLAKPFDQGELIALVKRLLTV